MDHIAIGTIQSKVGKALNSTYNWRCEPGFTRSIYLHVASYRIIQPSITSIPAQTSFINPAKAIRWRPLIFNEMNLSLDPPLSHVLS